MSGHYFLMETWQWSIHSDDWVKYFSHEIHQIGCLEDFIPIENVDLVFYERYFTKEIMAGSYMVRYCFWSDLSIDSLNCFRKSELGLHFLYTWADCNTNDYFPHNYLGSDNAEVHVSRILYMVNFHLIVRHNSTFRSREERTRGPLQTCRLASCVCECYKAIGDQSS